MRWPITCGWCRARPKQDSKTGRRRSQWRGGTLLAGVTKDLHYLVMAHPNSGSSKAQKAKKYGTECLDEAGFMAVISKGGGKAAAKSGSARKQATT